jgi:hypothetical protein
MDRFLRTDSELRVGYSPPTVRTWSSEEIKEDWIYHTEQDRWKYSKVTVYSALVGDIVGPRCIYGSSANYHEGSLSNEASPYGGRMEGSG